MICAIFLAALLYGIQKDLPVTPEVDEPTFVFGAMQIASTGNLHPGYFGTPGTTTFYPLALIYRVWHALKYEGRLLHADPNLVLRVQESPSEFYVLGRLLSVGYGVMSVLLVYGLGRSAFESTFVGLAGATFSILYPASLFWFQWVRTDSSGLFFGLLGLWACLRVYESPTKKRQVFAGIAIGLAVASRYFMVALIPSYIVANLLPAAADHKRGNLRKAPVNTIFGLTVAVFVFIVANPYLFLDFSRAVETVGHEARSTQLGRDGLSPLGNLVWYFTKPIPRNLTWPQAALSTVGALFVILKRHSKPLLILLYVAVFIAGISLSPLHWERWVIQVLPLFSLFAASGLCFVRDVSYKRLSLPKELKAVSLLISLALLLAWPIANAAVATILKTGPSTRLLTRQWLIENLPAGSRIVTDKYSAPLYGTTFQVYEQSWSPPDHSLAFYIAEGYGYLAMNVNFYSYFLAEPDRYSAQLGFYDELLERGRLLHEIRPSMVNDGSAVRIYALPSK